ncbi:nucleotide exchange factor GrpE [bacterium]|nr:nucleotide exchange factor GrpE [bacterium]
MTAEHEKDRGVEIPVTIKNGQAKPEKQAAGAGTEKQAAGAESEKEGKAAEYLEHLQRLQAEFSNYRKRVENEKREWSAFVKAELIRTLLPVYDDLARLLDHSDKPCSVEAVGLIQKNMKKVLEEQGLEEIDAVGTCFDPQVHEALEVEEVDDPSKEDQVLGEWQKGYRLNGRLLRPSRVKVGKMKGPSRENA